MEFTLNLVTERLVARESIRGVIWTIFFQRLFGSIKPTTSEFLEIPFPMAKGMPNLDASIRDKVDLLIRKYFGAPEVIQNGKIAIQFYDEPLKKKKKTGWFGLGKDDEDDKHAWEKWTIYVRCLPEETTTDKESSASLEVREGGLDNTKKNSGNHQPLGYGGSGETISLSAQLFEKNIDRIVEVTGDNKFHIPQITSLESMPFPYLIDVEGFRSGGNEEETWGNLIKKMLD